MALFGSKKNQEETSKTKDTKTEVAKTEKKTKATETKESMKDLYSDSSVKTETKKGKASVVTKKYKEASKILVRPLVTEKATNLATDSKYVFVVKGSANKVEVGKAIQSVYGVKPVDINIINMKGKQVSRGRIRGKRKDWKKAIVTLKKGDTIAIYEGV